VTYDSLCQAERERFCREFRQHGIKISASYLVLDIGDGESQEGESQTMRKLSGQGLYLKRRRCEGKEQDGRPEAAP